jgi:hypothetical protein
MGCFAGLIPIGVVLFLYFGPFKEEGILSGAGVVITISLGLTIIGCAIAGWLGHGWARYALVVPGIIHYRLVAYNNYNLAQSGIVPEGKEPLVVA